MGNKNKGPYCYCLHQLGDHANLKYSLDGKIWIFSKKVIGDVPASWIGKKCNKCKCKNYNLTFLDERIKLIKE
jgi:hypothetical protein